METIISILKPFFDRPNEGYHIREIARITEINHTTIRQYLNRLKHEGILLKKSSKPYSVFTANTESEKYLNLKLYYNLEKLRKSKLIRKLEEIYDFPTIVLFGSYAKSFDVIKSDIDIFVLTGIKKGFDRKPFEKILERNVNLHLFSEKEFSIARKMNRELINNICNGITLSGQLEVLR